MENLDSFSKILIATGQINYMAAAINSVNEQIKTIKDENGYHAEGIKERTELLNQTVIALAGIMEDMGNLINGQDCICAIDARVAKVPFEIICHGMDEVENDYETKKPE